MYYFPAFGLVIVIIRWFFSINSIFSSQHGFQLLLCADANVCFK